MHINRSLSSLGRSVQGAIKRTENISDNIKKRNLDKKESISMSKEFFAKRRDLQRRREKEELLEAGCTVKNGLFNAADKNNDGKLSKKELRKASEYIVRHRCPRN